MLFSILIGIAAAGIYFLKGLFIKAKFVLSGGKAEIDKDRHGYVIFSDSRRYWNIFKPVCDEMERRGIETEYWTCSADDPALRENYQNIHCSFIGEGNKAFAKLNMVKADIVFSTTPGLDVYQWKRSRDAKYYVHCLHAATDASMYRMFGLDFYDAVLLSGQYQADQVRKLEKLREIPAKELEIVGLPFMDVMKERLEKALPVPAHERTVLLAPSWGQSAIFSRYGGRIITELLKTGYHIIVRPHPQSYTSEKALLESIMKEFPASDQLEWNRDNDNFEVLRRSDILISDFSGVIYDFCLVFDRPVIYADTSFNNGPYDASWLNEEPWTFSLLPRVGCELNEENIPRLKELIDDCIENPRFGQGRAEAREEAWAHIGEAAGRTVDYLVRKRKELVT